MALSSRIIERYSPRSPVPLPSSASLPSHWLWQERVRRIHRGNRVNDCNVSPRLWAKGVRDQEDGLRHGQGSFAILPLARRKSDTEWWCKCWPGGGLHHDGRADGTQTTCFLIYIAELRTVHSQTVSVIVGIDLRIPPEYMSPRAPSTPVLEPAEPAQVITLSISSPRYYILISRCVAQDFSQSAYLMWFSWEHTTRGTEAPVSPDIDKNRRYHEREKHHTISKPTFRAEPCCFFFTLWLCEIVSRRPAGR